MLAPDIEELVCEYLAVNNGLPNVAVEMESNAPMPFYLVTRIAGADDMVTDWAVVSVHTFNTTRTGASTSARAVHGMMNAWGLLAKTPILVNGVYVNIDSVETLEVPTWRYYSDEENLHRYCARYKIGLRMNLTT